MFSFGNEVGLDDGVERNRIDDLSRTFGEDDTQPSFKIIVGEQRHILRALSTLGQGSEHQESAPTSCLSRSNTFDPDGKRIQITSCDEPAFHRSDRSPPSINEKDPGEKDASGEHPFRDFERDGRFHLAGPTVEEEEVGSGVEVDDVYAEADYEEEVDDAVGETGPA